MEDRFNIFKLPENWSDYKPEDYVKLFILVIIFVGSWYFLKWITEWTQSFVIARNRKELLCHDYFKKGVSLIQEAENMEKKNIDESSSKSGITRRNPKRPGAEKLRMALEAFEKAVDLDPNDLRFYYYYDTNHQINFTFRHPITVKSLYPISTSSPLSLLFFSFPA